MGSRVPCDDLVSSYRYCDRTLQVLLNTIFGILMLRKGPDAMPHSAFLFAAALAVLWSVLIAEGYLITSAESPNHLLSLALLVIHISSFWLILQITGRGPRFLQAVTASAACGAVVSLASLLLYLMLVPVIGLQNASSIPVALQLWLLVVDGHILSRSIDQHLLVGIAFVMIIFFAQLVFYSTF